MQIPIYQVDAFASEAFEGNPAAICPLNDWLPDELMQQIAGENNLSETAFIVPENGAYRLRWFTPTIEVDLCGHATLAAGFVLLRVIDAAEEAVAFETRSGTLRVRNDEEGLLAMDLPSLPPGPADVPDGLAEAVGDEPTEILHAADNFMLVYDDEQQVLDLAPDFRKLGALGARVIATAPGSEYDCISRYFAPDAGIDEDPVTGSAHSTLAPYWSERFGKDRIVAFQASARGGLVTCEPHEDRVTLFGSCALFMKGRISI